MKKPHIEKYHRNSPLIERNLATHINRNGIFRKQKIIINATSSPELSCEKSIKRKMKERRKMIIGYISNRLHRKWKSSLHRHRQSTKISLATHHVKIIEKKIESIEIIENILKEKLASETSKIKSKSIAWNRENEIGGSWRNNHQKLKAKRSYINGIDKAYNQAGNQSSHRNIEATNSNRKSASAGIIIAARNNHQQKIIEMAYEKAIEEKKYQINQWNAQSRENW